MSTENSLMGFYHALIEQIRAEVGTGRTALDIWAQQQFDKYGETMRVKDLAAALNVSEPAVRAGVKAGKLPGICSTETGDRSNYIIMTAMYVSWVFNCGHMPKPSIEIA